MPVRSAVLPFLMAVALSLLLAHCGKKDDGVSVAGSTKIVNGATTASRRLPPVRLSNGRWAVTPDTMTLTLTQVQFLAADGSGTASPLTNCTATFDKSKASLTTLSSCNLTVQTGTYYGMFIYVNPTIQATMNGSGGFYTDGTGIVTSPPAGGVKPTSFTYTSNPPYGSTGFASLAVFGSPLTVTASSTPEVTMVINGTHALKVDVQGGTATFVGDGAQVGHPDYVASANGVGKVSYYLDKNTAFADAIPYTGQASASLYYTGDGTPTAVFYLPGTSNSAICGNPKAGSAFNVAASTFPLNSGGTSGNFKYGGYLGRDANQNLLEWASATDFTWVTYTTLFTLDEHTTLGEAATLECKVISTDPAPAGGTFSPTITPLASPQASIPVKLVAH